MNSEHASIELEGLHNFRDVGGMPLSAGGTVRSGVLYRSDGLSGLTDAGVAALSASAIGVIVDFRTPLEQQTTPDRLPADRAFELVQLSVLEGALTGAAKAAAQSDRSALSPTVVKELVATLPQLGDMYVQMLQHGASEFAEAARLVAVPTTEHPPVSAGARDAVLLHCTAGKDRTGVAVALILDAVGADRDAVIADYTASGRNLAAAWAAPVLAEVEQMGAPLTPKLRDLIAGAPASAIEQAFAWLDDHGGSAAYLAAGGLTDDELSALRARLTA